MVKESKLYDLLGVSPDASQSDIKKAYRKKALNCHPDREPDEEKKKEKEKHFKEVSEAYGILSDDDKRQAYDRFGMDGVDGNGPNISPEDLFTNLFGGGGGPFPFPGMGGMPGMPGMRREKPKSKVQPVVEEVEITLAEAYTGCKKEVEIERCVHCSECDGVGCSDPNAIQKCTKCNGSGTFTRIRRMGPGMMTQQSGPCMDCRGKGKSVKEDKICKKCKGEKIMEDKKKFTVKIPAGADDKEQIIREGEGNQHPDADLDGDVVFIVRVAEHPDFIRGGKDLLLTHKIDLVDALCGDRIIIPHLDGRKIVLRYREMIDPNKQYAVSNEGFPNPKIGDRGNLIIKFQIRMPSQSLVNEKIVELKQLLDYFPPEPPKDNEDYYETKLQEHVPINYESESDDSDDDGPGGGQQCAAQ